MSKPIVIDDEGNFKPKPAKYIPTVFEGWGGIWPPGWINDESKSG